MIRSCLPTKKSALAVFFLFTGMFLWSQEDSFVSIYDDISDSVYGRSVSRSIVRGVRLDRFGLYRTLPVEKDILDDSGEGGFLTPLVFSDAKRKRLEAGLYGGVTSAGGGLYRLSLNGTDISFSLEKPGEALYREIEEYYKDWPDWLEPVKEHYRDNWIIRIHRAENVFEPWIDRITYNEALLSASLIADREQWLWGVHDGADILERN